MRPVQPIAGFADILQAKGASGWSDIGAALADPAVRSLYRRQPLTVDGVTVHAADIATYNQAFSEAQTIRYEDGGHLPGIYCDMTNGVGRKVGPDHPVFYRAGAVTLRCARFATNDSRCDLFDAAGQHVTADSSWLAMLAGSMLVPYLAADHSFALFGMPPLSVQIDQPCLFVGGQLNYYHFMIDHLPLLLLSRALPSVAGLPVVMHRFGPIQADLCRQFGFDPSGIAVLADQIDQPVFSGRLSQAVVPAKLPLPLSIDVLRRHLGTAPAVEPGRRRLFLVRPNNGTVAVRLANQTAVAAALAGLGFETIHAEDLTVREQAALFAEAGIMVFEHGAGLANMIFAPAKATVVELMNDHCAAHPHGNFDCGRKIAHIIGQHYFRLTAPSLPAAAETPLQDVPFAVDPDRLKAVIAFCDDEPG